MGNHGKPIGNQRETNGKPKRNQGKYETSGKPLGIQWETNGKNNENVFS